MKRPALLPCPFCGGAGRLRKEKPAPPELPKGWWTVTCVNSTSRAFDCGHGCGVSPMANGDTLEEAVSDWNTRAPVSTDRYGMRQLAAFVEVPGTGRERKRAFLLPAEFVGFWCELCLDIQSRKQAWTTLVHRWRNAHKIPGYATLPPPGKSGLPDGWSYANLCRLAPSAYELRGIRRGLKEMGGFTEGGAA